MPILGQDAMAPNLVSAKYIALVYVPSIALIVGTLAYQRHLLPFSVVAVFFGLGYVVYEINEASKTSFAKVLSPDAYQHFPIEKIDKISHNTAIYRFKLPEGSVLGLPIGQHVSIAAELDVKDPKTDVVERKEVARSYTPISSDINPGYFDLLVKSYPTGNISRHLATLKVGDTMKVKGPKGNMIYTPNMVRHFGMIAGGTGITPMLQIISAVQRGRNTGDKTEIDLLFANVNEEDILMRKELEEIAAKDKKIRVHYVLNNPPAGWKGEVGFVTGDMIAVSGRESRCMSRHACA